MKNFVVNLNPWDIQWNKDILSKIGARVYCNKEYYTDGKTFNFDSEFSDRKLGDVIKFFEGRPLTLCFQHNLDGFKTKPTVVDLYDPKSYKLVGDMMVALVSKYKGLTIEPDNELDANWDSRDMDGASHAAMMTAIYKRVKDIDPTCKVVLPGLSLSRFPSEGIKFFSDMKDWIDKNNGIVPFDRIALHIYSVSNYSVPISESDAIQKLDKIIPYVKKNFPLCDITINEVGVSMVEGNNHSPEPVAGENVEISAANLLLQTVKDFYNYDPIIKEVVVYNWQDNSGNAWDSNCGLLAPDGRHRPALTTMLQGLETPVDAPTTSPVEMKLSTVTTCELTIKDVSVILKVNGKELKY